MLINFFKIPLYFKWRMGFSLLCLFFFIVFILLGTWQLKRYDYKKNLLKTYHDRVSLPPKNFLEFIQTKNDIQFQSVSVEGSFLNELTLLIQNQMHNNQEGYEVLTPLKIKNEHRLLLVDRGWVKKPKASVDLAIKPMGHHEVVKGYIKLLNEYRFILGKNILNPNQTPIVIQKIDIDELSRLMRFEFFPFMLRLDGLENDGGITSILPERHLGYAIQWFVMAMVLLIAYFCFCLEKIEKNRVL